MLSIEPRGLWACTHMTPSAWQQRLGQRRSQRTGAVGKVMTQRGELEVKQASSTGLPHNFLDTQPWEWTLRECIRDFEFWRREFERCAVLIKTHVEKQHQSLGIGTEHVPA